MTLSVENAKLHVPSLEEIKDAFSEGLKKNFADVHVAIVDCPDLTEAPFGIAAPGLGGATRIADIGGVPNLTPIPKPEKVYSLPEILKLTGSAEGAVIGPGAGNSHFVGVNSEMMANAQFHCSGTINKSFVSKVDSDQNCHLDSYKTTDFGLMANLFISKGEPGQVIEVRAKQRVGEENFISSLRKSLECYFHESGNVVAMGGVFLIESGRAKFHVMPDFPSQPFACDADVDDWLHFYDFSAPLTVVSAFISEDIPDLSLRIEHSHGWSDHGQGGHYHYDTTPNEIAYRGYFNVAEKLFRIDKAVPESS